MDNDKQELIHMLLNVIDEIVEDTQNTLINHLIMGNCNYKSKKCSLYGKFLDILGDYL